MGANIALVNIEQYSAAVIDFAIWGRDIQWGILGGLSTASLHVGLLTTINVIWRPQGAGFWTTAVAPDLP